MAQYSEPVISPGLLELVDFNKPVSRALEWMMTSTVVNTVKNAFERWRVPA